VDYHNSYRKRPKCQEPRIRCHASKFKSDVWSVLSRSEGERASEQIKSARASSAIPDKLKSFPYYFPRFFLFDASCAAVLCWLLYLRGALNFIRDSRIENILKMKENIARMNVPGKIGSATVNLKHLYISALFAECLPDAL